MKLVYPDFQFKIHMVENRVNKLIIENPGIFSATIKEILRQSKGEDGRFVLSKNNEVIKMADNVICMIDPFAINFNDRKVITKLYGLLKSEVQNSEFWMLANQIFSEITQFTVRITEAIDYPIAYSDEIDISALFKLMEIKIDVQDEELTGQVIDYIKLMNRLLGYQVFVFVNLSAYLDSYELEQLYEVAMYLKMHLLMIESHVDILRGKDEKIYIIDKDGCEIY